MKTNFEKQLKMQFLKNVDFNEFKGKNWNSFGPNQTT